MKKCRGSSFHLWVGFADDITLFFQCIEDLQVGLQILADLLEEYGLKVRRGKTETMIANYAGDDYPESIVTLDS